MILIWLWAGLILLVGMLKLGWWQPIDQWGHRHLPDRRLSKFWRLVAVVGQPLVDVLIVILTLGMAGIYFLLVTWSRLILRAHHLSDVIVTLWLAITWFTTWYWLW